MDASSLFQEAEQLYSQGNHGEAIARLTSALRSNPNEQETQKIEALINKLGSHVFENGAGGDGSRDIGGGERGIGTQLASSFFAPSGSHNAQLGKLAMLGTVLAGSQKGSSGSGLQTAMSLLGGHQQGSGAGWASLASKFFSHGQAPSGGDHGGGPQQHHDTSTFSKLSSLAGSYMNNQGSGHGGGESIQHGGYGGADGSHGPQGSQGKFGAIASMAGNYLSDHSSNAGRSSEGNHNGGHSDGLSNLASVASNIMGHGPGRHEQPTAYGNPNVGDNGFNFTGGGHLGPM